ncbi:hypothetical protein DL240_05190 [Lujinxingia litoralis]|uniref:Uncharacterized protein n=1 Tax=Lujinxingia litoralis TaxID=2211119 RepID=A0A328C887_9DELT|nr:hypothetical protein [Lujinxingia litoralis]RAL23556.1 hypothetical protein DL240_05190 [Lujinxingia litoralis]
MSVANVFELNKCLDDSIRYCEEHSTREHCAIFGPRLRKARRDFNEALKATDRQFTQWRMESRDDKLAWKHLASELRQTQNELARVGAVGYASERVMYWDPNILLAAVAEMVEYLEDRAEQIDFAREYADKLQRQAEKARGESKEEGSAFANYTRFATLRSDAFSEVADTLSGFRQMLRRELGKENADYQSIRWPLTLSPDETVL